jgi:hypothetical protein
MIVLNLSNPFLSHNPADGSEKDHKAFSHKGAQLIDDTWKLTEVIKHIGAQWEQVKSEAWHCRQGDEAHSSIILNVGQAWHLLDYECVEYPPPPYGEVGSLFVSLIVTQLGDVQMGSGGGNETLLAATPLATWSCESVEAEPVEEMVSILFRCQADRTESAFTTNHSNGGSDDRTSAEDVCSLSRLLREGNMYSPAAVRSGHVKTVIDALYGKSVERNLSCVQNTAFAAQGGPHSLKNEITLELTSASNPDGRTHRLTVIVDTVPSVGSINRGSRKMISAHYHHLTLCSVDYEEELGVAPLTQENLFDLLGRWEACVVNMENDGHNT